MDAYGAKFLPPEHIEEVWLDARLPVARVTPTLFKRWLATHMAGLVFVCEKQA